MKKEVKKIIISIVGDALMDAYIIEKHIENQYPKLLESFSIIAFKDNSVLLYHIEDLGDYMGKIFENEDALQEYENIFLSGPDSADDEHKLMQINELFKVNESMTYYDNAVKLVCGILYQYLIARELS